MVIYSVLSAAETAVVTAEDLGAVSAVTKNAGFDLFLETLPIMGAGMVGIFAVTGIIIGAIYVLGKMKKKEK